MRLSRRRQQPAPPHVVIASLASPSLTNVRAWLTLAGDEADPRTSTAERTVTWVRFWPSFPDVSVQFQVDDSDDGGSQVRWTLVGIDDLDEGVVATLAKRVDYLVNDRLRKSFGQ